MKTDRDISFLLFMTSLVMSTIMLLAGDEKLGIPGLIITLIFVINIARLDILIKLGKIQNSNKINTQPETFVENNQPVDDVFLYCQGLPFDLSISHDIGSQDQVNLKWMGYSFIINKELEVQNTHENNQSDAEKVRDLIERHVRNRRELMRLF